MNIVRTEQLEQHARRVLSAAERADAVVVYNRHRPDPNFTYLTGLYGGVFDNCALILDREGGARVLSSALEEELLRQLEGFARILVYRNREERNSLLASALSGYGTVGVCFEAVSHALFLELRDLGGAELVDVSGAFRTARMVKLDHEIELIARAAEVASRVADRVPGLLRRGLRERDLAAEIDFMMKREGVSGPSFPTIVAFGPNASKPHYAAGGAALRPGDPVLVDFGASYRGYASDVTRTYLTGEGEAVEVYRAVLRAQQIALDMIKDGQAVDEVDREVRSYVDGFDRYRGRFIHNLGHSIGISVHDDGYPGEEFGGCFRSGMTLTVEPGIYLPGRLGVRIEDDVVVEPGGCRVLTTASKQPAVIELDHA
ncbi:MAG: M24 family metallopeptidase [Spirochaetota bacterium]